jgi:hypothetical protein
MSKKKSRQEQLDENWNRTWKDILVKEDGSIDVEQLKKELMDYSDIISRMIHLTSEVSGNRLSYPTYTVPTILAAMKEVREEEEKDRIADDKECGVCSYCGRDYDEE